MGNYSLYPHPATTCVISRQACWARTTYIIELTVMQSKASAYSNLCTKLYKIQNVWCFTNSYFPCQCLVDVHNLNGKNESNIHFAVEMNKVDNIAADVKKKRGSKIWSVRLFLLIFEILKKRNTFCIFNQRLNAWNDHPIWNTVRWHLQVFTVDCLVITPYELLLGFQWNILCFSLKWTYQPEYLLERE